MKVKSAGLNDKISFREKWRLCCRLIGVVKETEPRFIPAVAVKQFLSVAIGYLGIYVSSTVLTGLQEKRAPEELVAETLAILLLIFVGGLICGGMDRYTNTVKETCYDRWYSKSALKSMELDYPDLDSPYIKELRQRMNNDQNWGEGIWGAYGRMEFILYQLFNIIFAVGMLIPVIQQLLVGNRGILILFGVSLVILILGSILGEKHYNEKFVAFTLMKPTKPEDMNLTWSMAEHEGLGMENYKDIKIFAGVPLLREYLGEHGMAFMKRVNEGMAHVDARGGLCAEVFGRGGEGVCYFFVTLLAVAGQVSAGLLVRYVACFQRLVTGVQSLVRDCLQFLLSARRLSSTFEYLDMGTSLYRGKLPVEKRSDDEYEIEFRHVSFRYPGSEVYALRDFSLKLRIGERMAVVGRNGSGKTTMIKLLCRLYDPTEGEILLNGIDIRKFDYKEYMQLFSVVFQDFSLFAFTLGENIALTDDFDREKLRESMEKANFSERMKSLPKGVDTYLTQEYGDDGVLFSGGERQKVAIARALYRDSPFILLDEPTAALDPVAEFEVYSAFNEMVGSKTAVYISHRLSSCRFCNDIVVFDRGRIVQRGSHEQLMQQTDGLYHSLWMAQAEYYKS